MRHYPCVCRYDAVDDNITEVPIFMIKNIRNVILSHEHIFFFFGL